MRKILVICAMILALNEIRGSEIDLDLLEKVNFVVGVARIGSRFDNNSTQCGYELNRFLDSIQKKEIWAMKIVDSFGNIPSSYTWGNYFWFSSQELCDDLNDPYKITIADADAQHGFLNQTSPFPVEFRMIYYGFESPAYVDLKLQFEHTIHVGLCVPKSCSEYSIVNYTNQYFQRNEFLLQHEIDIKMTLVESKIPAFNWSFFLNTGVVIILLAFLVILTLIAFAEIILRIHKRYRDQSQSGEGKKLPDDEFTTIEKAILCFDIRANLNLALSVEESKNFMPVIAGMRTIVCLWVTLFHVYYYSLFTIKNFPLVFAKLENFILQPVLQSVFYVDVFFVISAFLLVFNFFSNSTSVQTIKSNKFSANLSLFCKLIVHRYLRLMPVLFIVMVMSEVVFGLLDVYSPFRMDQFSGIYCRDTWWYNIFFINNFLDLKYMCNSWAWYLGCEMQYFTLFLLMLFIHTKYEKAGKIIFCLAAVIFAGIGFYCNLSLEYSFEIDRIYKTLEHLYVKPWVRINPYFGGAFMGWLHYKTKNNSNGGIKLSSIGRKIFWLCGLIIYLTTIYISYFKSAPNWLVSLIMSFGKLCFGLYTGSVILVCQQPTHANNLFARVMGSKIFLFLNKFCFSIYLVAPVIIYAAFGFRTESTLFSEMGSGIDFIAIIALSVGVAFVLVILVEIPFQKLSSRFIMKKR